MLQPSDEHVYFLDDEAFHDTDRAGFRRRVVTGEHLQLCFWRIKGGATGSVLHHHVDNEQLGIVVRGKLDFRIGGKDVEKRAVLGPGEVYLAPRSVWHGDSVFIGDEELGECWILDVFAPPRDDLRAEG
jgi:mannose-6-phosphate isomerase-like protein (cupin superfamily)